LPDKDCVADNPFALLDVSEVGICISQFSTAFLKESERLFVSLHKKVVWLATSSHVTNW